MKNVPARYIAELLDMFKVFEVLNGAMASYHNKMVQQLVQHVKETHGQHISMVGGSDAETVKHVAKVHTVASDESLQDVLEYDRERKCFLWCTVIALSRIIAVVCLVT